MNFYRVYIVDPLQCVSRDKIIPVAEILSRWFDPIVAKAGFDCSHVHFPQFVAVPQSHELMVYICEYDQSIVQHAPGAKGLIEDPSSSPHKGVTLVGPPAASEVYLKDTNPLIVASLIFHELMHNKLQLGNSMHNRFSDPRLSAAMMMATPDFAPTEQENQAMVSALNKPVPQWAAGQEIVWRAARQREKGDPEFDSEIKFRK